MSAAKPPIQPVLPSSMELVFVYRCPHCGRKSTLIAPTQPGMVPCETCGKRFPIVPIDERTVHYVKIMLADGRAAVDADFI